MKILIDGDFLYDSSQGLDSATGVVTEIERYAIHDGPGVRSVIFLKGCPLRCAWCCNPETQDPRIELGFFADKCIGCRKCVDACPYHAISGTDLSTDRSVCRENCYGKKDRFPCAERCYAEAKRALGKRMSVQRVCDEIARDLSFYDSTGGGMTISGGEPLGQANFLYALLRRCKERWIHTALETCGMGLEEDYQAIAPYLDVLFMDLKSLNAQKFAAWAGGDVQKPLKSIALMNELSSVFGFDLYIRVPVIPDFNDTQEDIRQMGEFFIQTCQKAKGMELLPYHKLGRGKYVSVGREYGLSDLQPPDQEKMDRFNRILMDLGIQMYQF